jgi:hypothetical protein
VSKKTVTLKAGIAYMATWNDAFTVRESVIREFPEARIVEYELGFAVQIRRSGDYIGRHGRPSMENAIRAFDAAGKENTCPRNTSKH